MTFETYSDRMGPTVTTLVRTRQWHHPLLGEEDLRQEAMAALWDIWSKHHKTKDDDYLCRLGRLAIKADLQQLIRKTLNWRRYAKTPPQPIDNNGQIRFFDNEGTQSQNTSRHLSIPAGQEEWLERTYLEHGLAEIERTLQAMWMSARDRSVVWEMLEPSERTILDLRTRWRKRLAEVKSPTVTLPTTKEHLAAVASTLNRKPEEVKKAWRRIWMTTRTAKRDRCLI